MASVVACTWDPGHGDGAGALLTMARRCGDVSWLILGESPNNATDIAAKYGVATIHEISDTRVGKGGPDATVEALAQYCTHHGPRLALFSQDFESRLIAPRLAGRLGTPVAMNAIHLDIGDNVTRVTASAYGGDTHAKYCMTGPAPHIVAVMPNAVTPEPGATPSNPVIVEFTVALSAIEERIRVVTPAKREGPRLEDAKVIVAGGRGLGDPSKFRLIEELAEAIGGMPAASRPLVDDGWTDAARQVGLTGRITRPALYMAFGISGASQHMAGCSAAKTIVAVNRDPDAAIFRFARYGIVGDCLDIIPELIAAVREP